VRVVKLFCINVKTSTRNPRIIINTSVNAGINTINQFKPFCIKGSNPSLTIMGQGNTRAMSQLKLPTKDITTSLPNRSSIATDTGSFGATFQIKQKKKQEPMQKHRSNHYIQIMLKMLEIEK
jgi:hypothetical protein